MYIDEWEWDDGNRAELHRHGLNRHIVEQVAWNLPRFRSNRRGRAGTRQMIGPDNGGSIYTICIVESPAIPGLWRAITGWPATDTEKNWYRRSI